MKQTLKIVLTAFLITAGVIKAVPAVAEPAAVPNISLVRVADLDLASKAGRATLDHRLARAAVEVCGAASPADLVGSNQVQACRSEVLAKGRAEGRQLADRATPLVVAAR